MSVRSYDWYDEIYGFVDYAAASKSLMEVIARRAPQARSLLDVACGTGRHLEHFASRYACEGLDINEQMLVKAKARCPGIRFHRGSMIDFDLGSKFDVVSVLFSSIAYVKHPDNLVRTVCNLERHLAPGGVIVIEPFIAPEKLWTGRITANHVDLPDLKISWMYTSDPPNGNVQSQKITWMVGTPAGVEVFEEVHETGLFSEADWLAAFDRAALDFEYDPVGPFKRGLYILQRKASST